MIKEINGFPVLIRQSKRRKKLALMVLEDRIEVRTPPQFDEAFIADFLEDHEDWLKENTERQQSINEKHSRFLRRFSIANHGKVLLHGREIPVSIVRDKHTLNTALSINRDGLSITLNPVIDNNNAVRLIKRLFKSDIKQYIVNDFSNILTFYSERYGFHFNQVRIKNTRSRWGSCSGKRNINLHWKLVLMPEPVRDYVIVHELCHLKHLDHSRQFWNTLASIVPDYKEQKRWLKEHQGVLKGYELSKLPVIVPDP